MFPLRYIDPVYRPPSEADSLILPVTDGCSWNRCTFCDMYTSPQKAFRARGEAEVLESIRLCGERYGGDVKRVFLADGDATALSTRRLLAILAAIRSHLPAVHRISSYCLPRNLARKSQAEVDALAAAGLDLVYVGVESGNDAVLTAVNKGETHASAVLALEKLGRAGIKRSVMILNGLGGRQLWREHAEDSARLINAVQPEFLATLVLSLPPGETRFRSSFPDWEMPDQAGLFREMEVFLSGLELRRTVFRSDHASNWLVLKGVLGADKDRLLAQVRQALADPTGAGLRPAWMRGL